MPQKRLNPDLLVKMAKKTGKSKQYLREQISRRASRQSITSTAAQLVWAKQLGIGTANAVAKASPDVRQEVRSAGAVPAARPQTTGVRATATMHKAEPITAATIRRLL